MSVIVSWPHSVCCPALVSCQISAGEEAPCHVIAIAQCHLSLSLSLSLHCCSSPRNAHFPRYHLLKSITAFASPPPLSDPVSLSVQTTFHPPRTYTTSLFSFPSRKTRCQPREGIIPLHFIPKPERRMQSFRIHPSPLSCSAIFTSSSPSRFSFALWPPPPPPPPSDRFKVRPRR